MAVDPTQVQTPPDYSAPNTPPVPDFIGSLVHAVVPELAPAAQQAAQTAAAEAVAGVTNLASTLKTRVDGLEGVVNAIPAINTESVRTIATQAGQEATQAQKAVVQGVQDDLAQLQADFTAHRADVEARLAKASDTALTKLVNDPRFFWVEVGTLVVLAALTVSLLCLWIATGNARAEEVMKWVGIATLVKIPSGATAIAARTAQKG